MYHIVFSSSEDYLAYTSVLITSIVKCAKTNDKLDNNGGGGNNSHINCATNKSTDNIISKENIESNVIDSNNKPFCFHVISDFLKPESIEKVNLMQEELNRIYPCEIRIHIIDDTEFEKLNLPKWGQDEKPKSYATYCRIIFDRFMPRDIDKILYLDVDMLAIKDIRDIFDIDLKDKVMGAVYHSYCKKEILTRNPNTHKNIPIDPLKHYTVSLMLINIKQWREQNIESKIFDLIRTHSSYTGDQDYINVAVNDTIKIPYKYNCSYLTNQEITCTDESDTFSMPYTRKEYEESMNDLRIIHYNSNQKAWSSPYTMMKNYIPTFDIQYTKEWWDMAAQTPYFSDVLMERKIYLDSNELRLYATSMQKILKEFENKINILETKQNIRKRLSRKLKQIINKIRGK
ncbi:hypothetical protein DCO60_07050 [Helicobacter saguini]|uniref:glycosyltransferase family 8 protein n=1 Tax=Helicobacter saguini TaxID=1548018 RepID=UPI000E59B678|nr:glycosyltransferase [Helicobacter saguini]MWV62192.1 hypothetical protein [Helicobacter saguini]